MLESMEIPFEIIDGNKDNAEGTVEKAYTYMEKEKAPFALVVKKDSFESYQMEADGLVYDLLREDAVKLIIDALDQPDIVVSTTGMTSREVFEYREAKSQGHEKDFLIVGGMGHTSQVALGIAVEKPDRKVYCLDGDGSIIMHMGAMAINGMSGCTNFVHIALNNGAHDSVGGQPTVGHDIDFIRIAKACRYQTIRKVEKTKEIITALETMKTAPGPHFLEIRIRKGNRKGIGRPTTSPVENKRAFMGFLQEN